MTDANQSNILSLEPVQEPVAVPQEGMDLGALEDYAVKFGVILAGMFAQEPDVMPLDMDQLGLVIYCGVSAVAQNQPDYDPKTNVSSVVQLGIGAYAEGLYATVAQSLADDDVAFAEPEGE